MTRVLAVSVVKGGAGKTTTATTVARELARRWKVLLVDMDPQGHVAKALGIRNKVYDPVTNQSGACLSFLLEGSRPLNLCIVTGSQAEKREDGRWVITGEKRDNLFVIPATTRLKTVGRRLFGADAGAGTPIGDSMHFSNVLNLRLGDIVPNFDFVILDCPPNLDVFAGAVYRFADEVIIPVQPSDLDIDGLVQQARELRGGVVDGIPYKAKLALMVPTRTRMAQTLDQDIVAGLRERFGQIVTRPVPELIAVKRAVAYGKVISEFEAASPAAAAYREVADQVSKGGR